MSNSLRYRSNQASSKRPTSPLQQQRSNDKDPSRKEKRRRRQPYLPIAGVIFIVFALLAVFSAFFTEGISGIPHRSLRTMLGFGIVFQQDSIDYSKLPQCIDNYNDLPELWRPFKIIDANGKPKRLFMNENGDPQAKGPWTEQETLEATSALQKALYEILRYYHQEMTTAEVQDFQPDGINSLLDMTYGQEGLFHRTALKAARDQFVLVATPFMRFRPPIQNDSENEMHEEADKDYGDEDEKEKEESEDKYRQQKRHLDNQDSEDVEQRENEYKNQNRRVDNQDSEDAEEDENEYMPKNRHLASKDSHYAEESENDYSQQAKHLDDEDGQDASREFDEEVETRDEILKKEVSEDEEENDKDDLSEDSNKYDIRRRLKEETDDTPNSRRHHRDSCNNQYMIMKLADFGHYIVEEYGRDHVQEHDPELDRAYNAIIASVRDMIHSCGTLDRILQLNLTSQLFEDPDEDSSVVFDYVLAAIALVELSTIPDIDFSFNSAGWFVSSLWNYLSTYNLKYARDSPQHYWDPDTIAHAWLATHIAYLPSGYGRHANKVQDAPYLYKYIRENFYYAMENGRIDLVSEFVDLIRTYGCSEETDYQLRDGIRFVMNKFSEEMNGRWIDPESSDSHYNKIHVPWAGSAAVMLTGFSEPITPGSYGYAFYAMLRSQESQDSQDDVTQM